MTRAEYLAAAKKRALQYAERGELVDAVTSMGSDLEKHPELGAPDALMELGIMDAMRHDALAVRRWIDGWR